MAGPGPATSAVIVIFGAAVRRDGQPSATLRWRVEAAAAFASRFSVPLFVPTGGAGRFGPSEASVMARLLISAGVPSERILLEESSTDTLSSVRAVTTLLRGQGVTAPVFVATSLYHLPRCLLLLRLMHVKTRAAIPPVVPASRHWWWRIYWWLREVPALAYDATLVMVCGRR